MKYRIIDELRLGRIVYVLQRRRWIFWWSDVSEHGSKFEAVEQKLAQ